MFSHNGSFSINLGSQLNKTTNENENVINVMNSNGEIVKVISKETIDNMINTVKERTKTISQSKQSNNQILSNSEKVMSNLEALKERLNNTKLLKNTFEKSNDIKSVTSSFQWNYTIQTIRGVLIPMSGNLDW